MKSLITSILLPTRKAKGIKGRAGMQKGLRGLPFHPPPTLAFVL